MSKFAVVVFPDEASAQRGFHTLQQLRRSRCLECHGAALVARSACGELSLRKRTDDVPLGVAALVGALRDEFLASVERELGPGTFAVIAEVNAGAAMQALGGTVIREWFAHAADELPDTGGESIAFLVSRTAARRAPTGARRAERKPPRRGDPRAAGRVEIAGTSRGVPTDGSSVAPRGARDGALAPLG